MLNVYLLAMVATFTTVVKEGALPWEHGGRGMPVRATIFMVCLNLNASACRRRTSLSSSCVTYKHGVIFHQCRRACLFVFSHHNNAAPQTELYALKSQQLLILSVLTRARSKDSEVNGNYNWYGIQGGITHAERYSAQAPTPRGRQGDLMGSPRW